MNLGDLEITPPGVTRRAKVEHRETFVNLAIPIERASAISSRIVSSTTAERNEVKRDAGGLDRAKHGKPGG